MDKAKFQWMCSHTSERAADYLESMQQRANMLIGTSWYYDEFEGLGATEKFLMCLIHDISSEVWDGVESELGKELPPVVDYISDVLLRQEAKKARGMISRLPLAMEMLTQSTDNIWLDMTYESEITDADWTVEVIDILRESYTEAQTIMKEYREFIEWLDQDSQNCVKVVRLWNRCKEPIPQLHLSDIIPPP